MTIISLAEEKFLLGLYRFKNKKATSAEMNNGTVSPTTFYKIRKKAIKEKILILIGYKMVDDNPVPVYTIDHNLLDIIFLAEEHTKVLWKRVAEHSFLRRPKPRKKEN